MKVRVRYFGAYGSLAKLRAGEVELPEGSTLRDLIAYLLSSPPGLQAPTDKPSLEAFGDCRIYVGDQPIEELQGLDTRLAGGEVKLFFVSPIGGGSPEAKSRRRSPA